MSNFKIRTGVYASLKGENSYIFSSVFKFCAYSVKYQTSIRTT